MLSVNTNLYALQAQNNMRLNLLEFEEKHDRLSSGLRINRGKDDPSGLAIASAMDAQIHGVQVNMQNAEDGINLCRYIDGFLDNVQDILIRIRDLSVRMANEAVNAAPAGQNASDVTKSGPYEMYKEILVLGYDLWKKTRNEDESFNYVEPAATFNDKPIFQGEFKNGQALQVGPDNEVNHRVQVVVDDLRGLFVDLALPYVENIDGRMNETDYANLARNLIEKCDQKIDAVSNIRVDIAVIDIRLQHTIQDLMAEYVNVSAGKSRIFDAVMTDEIAGLTKNLIINNAMNAAAAQANAQPTSVIQLLDAIYNGLNPNDASMKVEAPS